MQQARDRSLTPAEKLFIIRERKRSLWIVVAFVVGVAVGATALRAAQQWRRDGIEGASNCWNCMIKSGPQLDRQHPMRLAEVLICDKCGDVSRNIPKPDHYWE